MGDYPAVQYIPPENNFHLDILTRLGEAYSYSYADVARDTILVDLGGLRVTTVSPRLLYEMKKETVRPKDHADAAALKIRYKL